MIEIGLAGPMGAGKTTVADVLVATHHYTRLSFADPLRYLSTRLLGRPIEKQRDRPVLQRVGGAARDGAWRDLDGASAESRLVRTAQLAHYIFPGATSEQVQALYDILYSDHFAEGWGDVNYWIQRWHRDYAAAPKPVVVDDCRFPIEGTYLAGLGFFMVRLDVPLEERQRRIIQRDGKWDPAWSQDPTEALVDGIAVDLAIDGTGTPAAIADQILRAAAAWKARLT